MLVIRVGNSVQDLKAAGSLYENEAKRYKASSLACHQLPTLDKPQNKPSNYQFHTLKSTHTNLIKIPYYMYTSSTNPHLIRLPKTYSIPAKPSNILPHYNMVVFEDPGMLWTPADETEKKAKEAFDSLEKSTEKAVIPNLRGKDNRFILDTNGYYGEYIFLCATRAHLETDMIMCRPPGIHLERERLP